MMYSPNLTLITKAPILGLRLSGQLCANSGWCYCHISEDLLDLAMSIGLKRGPSPRDAMDKQTTETEREGADLG